MHAVESRDRLKAAAEYACVKLHPPSLKAGYVRDIRAGYHADLIVYFLQFLSQGMTELFICLLGCYLYEKAKKQKRTTRKQVKLERLVEEQEQSIEELEKLLKEKGHRRPTRQDMRLLNFHKEVLVKVKKKDASIEMLVSESIELLENEGKKALIKKVNSYGDRYR